MQKQGIKIEGHKGNWYVIGESTYKGKNVYLLEHEIYGEDAPSLIVRENLTIVKDNIYNGFGDLEEED